MRSGIVVSLTCTVASLRGGTTKQSPVLSLGSFTLTAIASSLAMTNTDPAMTKIEKGRRVE